jgi:uncharacterized integral membrane protein
MRKVKLVAIVVILVLTTIIFVQNAEPVEARILFWPVRMSLALLLMLTFVLGLLAGILITTNVLRKRGRA